MALGEVRTFWHDATTGGFKRRGAAIVTPPPTGDVTLFDVDFDTTALGALDNTKWAALFGNTTSATNLSRSSIVNDEVNGGNAFRATLLANTVGTSNGVITEIPLPQQAEDVTFEMWFRFVGAFPWIKGGKLPGLGGVAPGISPNTPTGGTLPGSLGWSGRHMWLAGTGDGNWPDGVGLEYHYGYDQVSQYGDQLKFTADGTTTGTPVTFDQGTFHHLKTRYRMNTPTLSDGIIQTDLDGVRVVNRTNKRFRDSSAVKVSHLYWHFFRGGSTSAWASPEVNYIDVTRFRVTAAAT